MPCQRRDGATVPARASPGAFAHPTAIEIPACCNLGSCGENNDAPSAQAVTVRSGCRPRSGSCCRSRMGGRKPVPLLQGGQLLRPARAGLRRGARRCRKPGPGRHRVAHRAPSQRPRLPRQVDARKPAPRPRGKGYEQSRLGWAAQHQRRPCATTTSAGRAATWRQCDRKYSWGTAKEDFVLPEAHTVNDQARRRAHRRRSARRSASWSWQPRVPAARPRPARSPCADKLTIARVPYSTDRARSGVTVTVKLPDGRELRRSERDRRGPVHRRPRQFVRLRRKQSRPAGHVQRHAADDLRSGQPARDEVATRSLKQKRAAGLRPRLGRYVQPIPRRCRAGSSRTRKRACSTRSRSRDFADAFAARDAQWMSADCHRSQYGYPFRVAMQLALENRHRAVTLVHLACTGAEVTAGLFLEKDAREQFDKPNSKTVPAQFDQLSDLICRGGSAARTRDAPTRCRPVQSRQHQRRHQERRRCAGARRSSASGRSTSCCCRSAATTSASARSPTTRSARAPPTSRRSPSLIGGQIRFGADVTRVYLGVLDERLKAVKDAFHDGFGVPPSQVVQTTYEPLQYDETGALCGTRPTLGVDVHPKLRISRERIQEASAFQGELNAKLECITDASRRRDCPAISPPAAAPASSSSPSTWRSSPSAAMCARDPQRAQLDGTMMAMPRKDARRRLPAVQSGQRAALRASLAAVPHAERCVPHGQHAPRRHLAVRHHAAGLRGALQRCHAPDRGRPRDRRRQRDAARARDRHGAQRARRRVGELSRRRA